jgi:hypothetical protein
LVGVYGWIEIVDHPETSIFISAIFVGLVSAELVVSYYALMAILRSKGGQLPFGLRGYLAILTIFPFIIQFLHAEPKRKQADFIDDLLNAR